MADAGKWGDLAKRLVSAAVMVAVGGVEVWLGGVWFHLLAILLTGGMIWELARMTAPARPSEAVMLGSLGAGAMALAVSFPNPMFLLGFLVVPAVGLLTSRSIKPAFAAYALAIQIAVLEIVVIRDSAGIGMLLWIVAVVIASDVLGYFAGRLLGGPKFWPKVSPKKTWSGTIAGWIGAGLVGAAYVHWAGAAGVLVILSMVVAFAGQMGDIAESAIKRATGIKDSSNLIPGHGGLLDRFDALIGAALVFALIQAVTGSTW